MKLKVIKKILDGVIAANKNYIICFNESSLRDKKGEDALYWTEEGIYIGQILTDKMHRKADYYWKYTTKEWMEMNNEFALARLEKYEHDI